ncbi:ABC transporter ATP-binding protein [Telmatospirillum sp. J64-1]|uniref:ABC transporter ATP-binding protein n=1 Tax=Telmatospirillum sp. J64-1 TaxID=2502183 RepID=UPI00115ED7A8|nr:ABC transporter ATP-binding protein [Telmatospirillum sp. J64-1]
MISIRDLTHIYPGSRRQAPRTAISGLTLDVGDGEFCILSGPNGSGKSTLFRILCGMSLPSAGSITIAGADLIKDPAAARRAMAVVFQSPAVDKHLTVIENIRIHADLYGLRGAVLDTRMEEALGWSDLGGRMDEKVDTLSGGLARQVELAKCLLTRPRLLLLDEPTTGLDPNSRRNFLTALRRLQRERGMTVLMTSHIFSEAEDADRVAIMRGGELLAYDTPQALRAMIGTEMVVVQPRDPAALELALRDGMGLTVRRYGDELRLEETDNGKSLPLLEAILERHRPDIVSISIKQPALEDVFVHVTARRETPAAEPRVEPVKRTGT